MCQTIPAWQCRHINSCQRSMCRRVRRVHNYDCIIEWWEYEYNRLRPDYVPLCCSQHAILMRTENEGREIKIAICIKYCDVRSSGVKSTPAELTFHVSLRNDWIRCEQVGNVHHPASPISRWHAHCTSECNNMFTQAIVVRLRMCTFYDSSKLSVNQSINVTHTQHAAKKNNQLFDSSKNIIILGIGSGVFVLASVTRGLADNSRWVWVSVCFLSWLTAALLAHTFYILNSSIIRLSAPSSNLDGHRWLISRQRQILRNILYEHQKTNNLTNLRERHSCPSCPWGEQAKSHQSIGECNDLENILIPNRCKTVRCLAECILIYYFYFICVHSISTFCVSWRHHIQWIQNTCSWCANHRRNST